MARLLAATALLLGSSMIQAEVVSSGYGSVVDGNTAITTPTVFADTFYHPFTASVISSDLTVMEDSVIYFDKNFDGVTLMVGGVLDLRNCIVDIDYTELPGETAGDDTWPKGVETSFTVFEADAILGMPHVRINSEHNAVNFALVPSFVEVGNKWQMVVTVKSSNDFQASKRIPSRVLGFVMRDPTDAFDATTFSSTLTARLASYWVEEPWASAGFQVSVGSTNATTTVGNKLIAFTFAAPPVMTYSAEGLITNLLRFDPGTFSATTSIMALAEAAPQCSEADAPLKEEEVYACNEEYYRSQSGCSNGLSTCGSSDILATGCSRDPAMSPHCFVVPKPSAP